MNEKQQRELVKRVTEFLRDRWGDDFTDDDAARISEYCIDEAEDEVYITFPLTDSDIHAVAMDYEMRYG